MLELLFQGFFEWIYGMILEIWEYFSGNLLDLMSMDFAYLQTHIPVLPVIRQSMLAVGWALLIGNLVFQALRGMLTGIGFEVEDPKLLFARSFVFSFLLLASPQICELCLNMTATIIHIVELPTAVNIDIIQESVFDGLACAWLLVFICGIIVMFQSFKLIFEMAERYLILAVLTICAPLAFGVGGSRSTSDIFSGWCRMYGSMCLLMVLNVVFVKMLLSVLSTVPTGLAVLPWMVLVVSIVKVAKKADSIVTRIGLSPAITGDSLGRTLPGMLGYMMLHTAVSHAAQSAIRSAAKGGKASGSGAQGTKQSVGSGGPRTAQNSTGKAGAPRQEQTRRKQSGTPGWQGASPVKPVTVSAEDFNDAVKSTSQREHPADNATAGTASARQRTRQENTVTTAKATTEKTPTSSTGAAEVSATRKTSRPATRDASSAVSASPPRSGTAGTSVTQKTARPATRDTNSAVGASPPRSGTAGTSVAQKTSRPATRDANSASPPRSGTAEKGVASKSGIVRNQAERHSRNTHSLTQKEVHSNETMSGRTARQEQRLSMTETPPAKPGSEHPINGTAGTDHGTGQTRLSVRETASGSVLPKTTPNQSPAKATVSAPAQQERKPIPTVTPDERAQAQRPRSGTAGTAARQTMRESAGRPAEARHVETAQQENRRDPVPLPQANAPAKPIAASKNATRKSASKKGDRKKRGKP